MSEITEQILKDVSELKNVVTETLKSESEKRAEFEKRVSDIVEAQKQERRRRDLPDDAPLDPTEEKVVGQKGGLFGGKMRLPYKKMLAISPSNESVRAAGVGDHLRTIQDLHDACAIRFWTYKLRHDETTANQKLREDADFKLYASALERAGYFKADEILHPGAAPGSNLDFTLLSAQLLDKVRIELVVANQFRQLPLTRANQEIPTLTADSLGVLGGSSQTAPPPKGTITGLVPPATHFSNPTFAKVTFGASHCLGYIQWNDDMLEDSVIPFLPVMREQAAISIARAIDQCVLNGDSSGTHMDTNVTDVFDFRKAWFGLRKASKTNQSYDAQNGVLLLSDIRAARALMGIYGRNANQLFYTMSPSSYYELLKDSDVRTIDVFGPQATVKTGVLAKVDGSDIVMSEFIQEDLDSTAVYTGTNTDRTTVQLANRDRWIVGQFGTVAIETTRWAPMLYTIIQADVRVDFQPIEALSSGEFAAGAAPAAIVRNINPA